MLLIPLGDPYSINIEIVNRSLQNAPDVGCVLFGSYWQWCNQIERLQSASINFQLTTTLSDLDPRKRYFFNGPMDFVEKPAELLSPIERGKIAYWSLTQVEKFLHVPNISVITCPIDKAACVAAGLPFVGQTEYFEHLTKASGIMILAGPRIRVGLVTNHVPIRHVAGHITAQKIAAKLQLFAEALGQHFNCKKPRIAVCGLNPHAGDSGLIGHEDQEFIAPVVRRLNEQISGCEITGPHAADTVFYQCFRGKFDGVLAMYHDQGLPALKALHFYDAINLTAGLPLLRVSPDHGPAKDLFLQGVACTGSFSACLAASQRYCKGS